MIGPPWHAYENARYWQDIYDEYGPSSATVGYKDLGEGFNRRAYELPLEAVERLLGREQGLAGMTFLQGAVGIGAYAQLWGRLPLGEWTGVDISQTAVDDLSRRFPGGRFHHVDLTAQTSLDDALGIRRSES
jgi:hypothetical protein